MTLPVLHEADYVIVGAGSAGSFLAAELAQGGQSVCVIEAGPMGRNPLLNVPLMTGVLLRSNGYTWQFKTQPQPALHGRQINWPRGRVVGGSGAINGMVWVRGLPSDYDAWAAGGLNSWSWDQVRPVFDRIEGIPGPGGEGRALGLEEPDWWTGLYDAFIAGAEHIGQPRCADFNSETPEGVGRYRFNIRGGRRSHTGRLLKAAIAAGKVNAITEAHTLHLELTEGRATGVAIRRGGSDHLVRARREIILCAGTAGSPAILMRSGIGDPAVLAQAGVAVQVASPGVGKGIQDHLLIRVEHAALKPGELNSLLRIDRAALAMARAILFGTGPASCFPLLTGGYFRSAPDEPLPDLQSHFMPALSSATLRINPFRSPNGARAENGFFANIFQMRPESRGTISIASPDPMAAPVIDPQYLSAERDRVILRRGVRLLRRLFASPSFGEWRGPELAPGAARQSDAEIDAWISSTAESVYHPTGGCCMGTGAEAVLDGQLRVRGVAGLRVADASVMPSVTSNNTNAPTVMIAARCADFIREGL